MSITVITKEGLRVIVESKVASCFGTVTSIIDDIEDSTSDTELPLTEVDFETLVHIINFYSGDRYKLVESLRTDSPSKETHTTIIGDPCDPDYLSSIEDEVFFKIFTAANYLEASKLLDVCAKWLADIVLDCKTPDAIRARFNITTEPTEEESKMIAKECDHIVSTYNSK